MKEIEIGSWSDNELGNLSETLARKLFDRQHWNYQAITQKDMQAYLGDYIALNKHNEARFIEVKTSHTFKNKDKIAMDYKYTKNNSCGRLPYIQSNTNDNLGWIYNSKSHVLVCVNPYSKKLYVIRDYQTVKKNILNLVEEYNSKVNDNTWHYRGHNNYIHKYLEGSVKKTDYCKESLIVNLELSEKSIEYFGGRLWIYDIISNKVNDTDIKAA